VRNILHTGFLAGFLAIGCAFSIQPAQLVIVSNADSEPSNGMLIALGAVAVFAVLIVILAGRGGAGRK
jgi:hypothetical protein